MTAQIATKKNSISGKIKISQSTEKELSFKNNKFYSKYSRFIFKALGRYRFQEFLNSMLKLEDIDEKQVDSIKIALYPVHKRRGFGIAGTCNPFTGKIWIYPKTEKFCDAFSEKYGRDLLVMYAGNRARASLIHELLHLKYTSDEDTVRVLTRTYFSEYIRENDGQSGSLSVYNLIFKNVE